MSIFIRWMYYCTISCIIVWISGCSSKCSNIRISSLDYMDNRLYSSSKLLYGKNIINNVKSFDSLKQYNIPNNNRYIYNDINKGSYSLYSYRVRPGDTLFYIAWITGNNYRVLAKKNNIDIDDILKVGQVLRVDNNYENVNRPFLERNLKNSMIQSVQTSPVHMNTSRLHNVSNTINGSTNVGKSYVVNKCSRNSSSGLDKNFQKVSNDRFNSNVRSSSDIGHRVISNVSDHIRKISSISWSWPASGRIINNFSSSEGGNKGIDISGVFGQPVFAASSGKVVYAGNALFGYGNLIIIKHDNNFLSTYAHNDKILVAEQQNVILGQKIATMGSSGSDITKLRFEIRYKGRSVDPLCYLPKK